MLTNYKSNYLMEIGLIRYALQNEYYKISNYD